MGEDYKDSASGDGWWQRDSGPREPITEVQLFFYEGRFSGSGIDERGIFTLRGRWLDEGQVAIRKHYGPIPGADLIGRYDGEGTFTGRWSSEGESGMWALRITGPLKEPDAEAMRSALARMGGGWNSTPRKDVRSRPRPLAFIKDQPVDRERFPDVLHYRKGRSGIEHAEPAAEGSRGGNYIGRWIDATTFERATGELLDCQPVDDDGIRRGPIRIRNG